MGARHNGSHSARVPSPMELLSSLYHASSADDTHNRFVRKRLSIPADSSVRLMPRKIASGLSTDPRERPKSMRVQSRGVSVAYTSHVNRLKSSKKNDCGPSAARSYEFHS